MDRLKVKLNEFSNQMNQKLSTPGQPAYQAPGGQNAPYNHQAGYQPANPSTGGPYSQYQTGGQGMPAHQAGNYPANASSSVFGQPPASYAPAPNQPFIPYAAPAAHPTTSGTAPSHYQQPAGYPSQPQWPGGQAGQTNAHVQQQHTPMHTATGTAAHGATHPVSAPHPHHNGASSRIAVIDSRFVMPTPQVLKMREAAFSFSGDDFTIDDAVTRRPWFRIDGRAMSLNQRKTLLDSTNRPIAYFTSELFSLRGSMTVSDLRGRPIFTVTPQIKLLDKEMLATARNLETGAQVPLVVKGNFRGSRCTIFVGDPRTGGREIASVKKQTINIKTMLTGQQDYTLSVAAGVDVALCVLLALAFDEKYHDKN